MRSLAKQAVVVPLAALSALVVHQLAYVVAYPAASVRATALGDHRHLAFLWSIVGPLSVVAAVCFVLRQVRQLSLLRPVTATLPRCRLAVLTAGLFVAQESIEAAALGHHLGRVVVNPAIYVGIALAPLVAAALERLLRGAWELVAQWLAPPPPLVAATSLALRPVSVMSRPVRRASGSSPRGPPR